MGIYPILSDLNPLKASKLDWKYFERNKIDRKELQIFKNSQKGTGTKMAQNLNNFEKCHAHLGARLPLNWIAFFVFDKFT